MRTVSKEAFRELIALKRQTAGWVLSVPEDHESVRKVSLWHELARAGLIELGGNLLCGEVDGETVYRFCYEIRC